MSKSKKSAEVAAMLDSLQAGETLLVRAIKTTNSSKVQLEFAERMTSIEGNSGALLGLLNASDARFSNGARRAWMTAEINDVAKQLDINCGDDADWEMDKELGKEVLPLGRKNQKLGEYRLRVKIAETVVPTDYQKENLESSAKRRGSEGTFITHKGQYIFSNTEVVAMKGDAAPEHVILVADAAPVSAGIVDETQSATL